MPLKTQQLLNGSEQSMIPIIKDNAFKIGTKKKIQNLIALEEFAVGTGISDLTIFTIDKKLVESRKKSDVVPVTSKNSVQILLGLLDHGELTIDELSKYSGLRSKSSIQQALDLLIKSNLVVNNGGVYRADYSLKDHMSDDIIAIEAKVKDWRSGVRQAMRYKEYADFSYLAIYEDNISGCLKNIDVFKKLGIGLIGVSDGDITIHLEATASTVTTIENKVLAYERLMSVVDERFESYVARNNFSTYHAR
jgi:predicted transcriptional regulator